MMTAMPIAALLQQLQQQILHHGPSPSVVFPVQELSLVIPKTLQYLLPACSPMWLCLPCWQWWGQHWVWWYRIACPLSCYQSSGLDDSQEPCASSLMAYQQLAMALATMILLTTALLFAALAGQSGGWKQTSVSMVWNLTDGGVPI